MSAPPPDEAERVLGSPQPGPRPNGRLADDGTAGTIARSILRLRRKRDVVFGAALFADPAWDILLSLLVAEEGGRDMWVASLCIETAVPPTTALRWIDTLAEAGLIRRKPHPQHRGDGLVSLAPETSARLRSLLADLTE